MGLGGVTIAALHAVMCLEVPFSDGLGGQRSCRLFLMVDNLNSRLGNERGFFRERSRLKESIPDISQEIL